MADDVETLMIRKSLDSVDRSKRIAALAIGLLFFAIVLALGFALARARTDTPGASKLLWSAAVAQMAFVGICTWLLASHITRMTKAVLRAIELAQKK